MKPTLVTDDACANCVHRRDRGQKHYCHEASPTITFVVTPSATAPGWQVAEASGWPEVRLHESCSRHPRILARLKSAAAILGEVA